MDIDESLNYTAHTGLIYRKSTTYENKDFYLYYSDPDDATATTITINGSDYTLSDLEVQDSSSSTGWSAYSSDE